MALITLVAGTEAKVSDLNNNFEYLDGRISNTNTTVGNHTNQISTANTNIANLQLNMSALQQEVKDLPANDVIEGLLISKTSSNTISVASGSCFDSTKEKVLKLASTTSKTNSDQSANTKYYVYLIANEGLTSYDILVTPSSSSPSLPTGYTYYRQIGDYTTDGSGNISVVNSLSSKDGINYSGAVSWGGGTHTASSDGLVVTALSTGNTFTQQIIINGIEVYRWVTGNSNGAFNAIGHARVCAGDSVYIAPSGTFYPARGV